MVFSDSSCFVLTQSGIEMASKILHAGRDTDKEPNSMSCDDGAIGIAGQILEFARPHWDADRHELFVGQIIVKRFRWPAINQATVLSAFEEDGWPARVDDPLPPQPEQDSKRRLHDTIKCLNRNQINQMVRFRGDGTGQGVLWDLVSNGKPKQHKQSRRPKKGNIRNSTKPVS